MVYILKITDYGGLQRFSHSLGRLKTSIPVMPRRAMRRWGNVCEKHLKRSARQAGISSFRGEAGLFGRGIEYRQAENSDYGQLFMRIHGVYLDSMEDHWVSLKRSRGVLMAWARSARSPEIRHKAGLVDAGLRGHKGIYVHRHPFIAAGMTSARSKLRPVIRREAQRTIKESFGGS
jgi:hypothetical protein